MLRSRALALLAVCAVAGAHAVAKAASQAWPSPGADYLAKRQQLVDSARSMRFDAGMALTAAEAQVNATLMAMKVRERQSSTFAPAVPWLRGRALVDASPLLPVLKSMPKGGILHLHGDAGADLQWVVENVTHRANCYMYTQDAHSAPSPRAVVERFAQAWQSHTGLSEPPAMSTRHNAFDGSLRYRVAMEALRAHVFGRSGEGSPSAAPAPPPSSLLYGSFAFWQTAPAGWTSCATLRATWDPASHGGAYATFDDYAVALLSINLDSFNATFNAWAAFQPYFSRDAVLAYAPVAEEYFRRVFTRAATVDNVEYLEFRLGGMILYDLDHDATAAATVGAGAGRAGSGCAGTVAAGRGNYTMMDTLKLIQCVSNNVAAEFPTSFYGARIIATGFRELPYDQMRAFMNSALGWRQAMPDFVRGFDIAGQEDLGFTLLEYSKLFLELAANASAAGVDMPLILHVGETTWASNEGQPPPMNLSATNLYDALLLNSRRLGHGLALAKFPSLVPAFREAGVALEICPISNQELQMVEDMRNHPATALLSAGMPVTISPDDPTPLNDGMVSYDWYMAFASWDVDLASLKQMTRDSLQHALLSDTERAAAMALYQTNWDAWIASFHSMPEVVEFEQWRRQRVARGKHLRGGTTAPEL